MRVLAVVSRIALLGAALACNRERPSTIAQHADTARPVVAPAPASSPDRELLQSASDEIRVEDLQVRFTSELRVLSILDQSPGMVQIDATIRLLMEDARGVPATILADRIWIIDGDSMIARSLPLTTELARIDSGPWFRHQRASGEGPAWLNRANAVDVVIRITRDGSVIGYLRASRQAVVNYPRIAREKRSRYPTTVRREGASYFGTYMGGELAVMQGEYDGTQWSHRTITLDVFSPGHPLQGLDRAGRSISVRYDTIPADPFADDPWEYSFARFDSTLSKWVSLSDPTCLDSLRGFTQVDMATGIEVKRECADSLPQRTDAEEQAEGLEAFLFWSGPVSVRAVTPTPAELDPVTLATLERRGRELWSAALAELPESDRPTSARFGARRNEAIAGVIVSWWQVILGRTNAGKTHGQACFSSTRMRNAASFMRHSVILSGAPGAA
jgi:hypothetical protein